MKTERVLHNLLEKMLPNRASPDLAAVKKVYESAGKGKYCADVMVLEPGSLKEIGPLLPEVPISPVWAGKNGQGIYCLPEEGIVVVVDYIAWNRAFPYISGIWSDQYDAADHPKGSFILTDGKGTKFGIDTDSLFMFETQAKSLKDVLEKMIDETKALKTIGSPSQHIVSPDSIAKLEAIKTEIADLIK